MVGLAQAAPLRSTLDDQKALAVTVYNGDLALVKDTRQVNLPAGQSVLELRDVSAQMRPETAGDDDRARWGDSWVRRG